MKKIFFLIATHGLTLALGFALGIYVLPILTARDAPTVAEVSTASGQSAFKGEFRRDLKDSDALHWGEGTVSVSPQNVAFAGKLAPGPDYKLYLSPEFVETEADFNKLKPRMVRVGDVRTFDNFIVPVPASVNVSDYKAVIVWCESFGQFISAAKYR